MALNLERTIAPAAQKKMDEIDQLLVAMLGYEPGFEFMQHLCRPFAEQPGKTRDSMLARLRYLRRDGVINIRNTN